MMDPLVVSKIANDLIAANEIDLSVYPVVLVGIRGYFLEDGGAGNDRGIYDDLLVWCTPRGQSAYRANTDPSVGFKRGLACLKPGVWLYKPGNHNSEAHGPYEAFRQAGPVTVVRDGVGEDTGMFGINIHRGSRLSTSSLGCQTLQPDDWPTFKEYGYLALKREKVSVFTYLLVEEVARRAGLLKV